MISSYKVVLSAALHKSNDGLTRLSAEGGRGEKEMV